MEDTGFQGFGGMEEQRMKLVKINGEMEKGCVLRV